MQLHHEGRQPSSPWVLALISLALGATACLVFAWATEDAHRMGDLPLIGTFFASMPAAAELYWGRFFLSFVMLGLLPFVCALLMGIPLKELGLSFKIRIFRHAGFWAFVILAFGSGFFISQSPEMAAYYPYYHGLTKASTEAFAPSLWLHIASLSVLYYLPWELFFRGFLLLAIIHIISNRSGHDFRSPHGSSALPIQAQKRNPTIARKKLQATHLQAKITGVVPKNSFSKIAIQLLQTIRTFIAHEKTALAQMPAWLPFIILFQTIPSTLLHGGHPLTELFGAILGGIIFGVLAFRCRSFVPGMILHAAMGIGVDVFIILKYAGAIA